MLLVQNTSEHTKTPLRSSRAVCNIMAFWADCEVFGNYLRELWVHVITLKGFRTKGPYQGAVGSTLHKALGVALQLWGCPGS